MKHAILLPVLALACGSVACGAAQDAGNDGDLSTTNAEEVVKMCGGIAGLTCPKGYDCTYAHHYPDAAGTCVKHSCVQTEMCALTAHFDTSKHSTIGWVDLDHVEFSVQ